MKRKLCMTICALSVLTVLIFASSIYAQDTAAPAVDGDKVPSEMGGQWRVEDFHPYVKALDDLRKLSKEYAEKIMIKSIDEYSIGMDILRDMDANLSNLQKQYDRQNNLNERWYWQEIDRENQLKRRKGMLKYSAKLRAITYFTRSINSLDQIQSEEVRKDPKFVEFQIRLFKAYVSAQYDIHNLKPCIPILERYIAINDNTKQDVQAYKYLASCYGYMEKSLAKYNTTISEERVIKYKQKKNQALLMATEIEYGIESIEYRKLKDIVEIDEIQSERINNFR
ncbi:MAG TPA: hypothetical protein P5123_04765 [Spirochaetota bacterium]|nr:hypothetical protein [Spirochaetota bacterium]